MEIFHGDLLVYQKVFSCSSPKPCHSISSRRSQRHGLQGSRMRTWWAAEKDSSSDDQGFVWRWNMRPNSLWGEPLIQGSNEVKYNSYRGRFFSPQWPIYLRPCIGVTTPFIYLVRADLVLQNTAVVFALFFAGFALETFGFLFQKADF